LTILINRNNFKTLEKDNINQY